MLLYHIFSDIQGWTALRIILGAWGLLIQLNPTVSPPPPGSFPTVCPHLLAPPTQKSLVFLLSHITGSFRTQLLQWFFISWGFLTVHFYSFPVTRDCFPCWQVPVGERKSRSYFQSGNNPEGGACWPCLLWWRKNGMLGGGDGWGYAGRSGSS